MTHLDRIDSLRLWAGAVRRDSHLLPEGVSPDGAYDAQKYGLNAVRAIRDDAFYFKHDGPCVASFAVGEARRAFSAALAAIGLGREL